MKNILFVFFVMLSSFAFGQYGHWEPTGRKPQKWPVTIVWDTLSSPKGKEMPTEPGYCYFIEFKFVRGPSDSQNPVKNRWVRQYLFFDLADRPVEGVHHIIYEDPNTGKKTIE